VHGLLGEAYEHGQRQRVRAVPGWHCLSPGGVLFKEVFEKEYPVKMKM
jgi:hypothetical protein